MYRRRSCIPLQMIDRAPTFQERYYYYEQSMLVSFAFLLGKKTYKTVFPSYFTVAVFNAVAPTEVNSKQNR